MTTVLRALRRRRAGAVAALIAANLAAWAWAWVFFAGDLVLLGTAALAYGFGLRHAFDADHIAAIDNAARKLVEEGKAAAATGFFFSLGHATVVVLASLGIAQISPQLQVVVVSFQPFAGAFAAGVSAVSLFLLAAANCLTLASAVRLSAALRRGERLAQSELRRLRTTPGPLGRLLRGSTRLISQSWQLYPLGFLFGLGFDTASEIGLLAISALQAAHRLPLAAILIFPALFAAGMMLVDTLEGWVMAGAYRWASIDPRRRLYYNLAVGLISVSAAALVGAVELLGLTDGGATGEIWIIAAINNHSAAVGVALASLLAVTWAISVLIWRRRSALSG